MIEKSTIEEIVKEHTKGTGIFLVAVKVSSSGKITVLADKDDNITIDECVAIHRHIESRLDRDKEDYELQVSSPGLDMPFGVYEQYLKNQGKRVEVVTKEGQKLFGILRNVTQGGFDLDSEIKSKGKKKETEVVPFNFDEIKSTKVILTIK
jgi:ribosome maturation factor RimP